MSRVLLKKTLIVGLIVSVFTGIVGYQLGAKLWDNFGVKDERTVYEQQ